MSEVSSWSNTDAGNNLTPPDGWPEGMQPSGVNDVGRMMMGAIKRWYDTVTAGIANCLPLSGGTLTGNLVVPFLQSNGNISAVGDVGGRSLYMSADVNASGDLHANSAVLTGGLTASLDISARNIAASGGITASGDIHANSVVLTGGLTASLDVSARNISASGTANVTGALTAGSIGTSGALTAGSISTGTLTAASLVNTVTYQLSGTNFATTRTDVAGTCNAIFDGGGGLGIDLYGVNGSYYRCDNAHSFTNRAATVN
ncbi:MAG TPA: hypothetical protein VNH21_08725, partial [Steroidobacteraceae bacterium]|nr:hypothetical protein [Steroidobacteraceae bacterium]